MQRSFAEFWTDVFGNALTAVRDFMPRLYLMLLVFAFFFLIAQLFKLYGTRRFDIDLYKRPEPEKIAAYNKNRKKVFIGRFFWLLFTTVGVGASLAISGLSITTVVNSLGFLGAMLSFALSSFVQQYFAGFLILVQEHINIGEQVRVGEVRGVVKAIESRYTVLRDYQERDVLVPNSTLLTSNVAIEPVQSYLRDFIRVRIDNAADPRKVIQVGEEALRSVPGIDPGVPPRGYLRYFGEAMHMAFYVTIPSARRERFITRNECMIALKEAFAKTNIQLSYPAGMIVAEYEED